ncbi:unnamed protein product [Triticum turgidum subsp. durum]|uniref:FAS1 domain-containing protein n=1 Tax=Triticum turgidum subsp. durum TaxID=4567 RepID=A0A9R0VKL9_TRITD|nr:unnamed protein product [Triticum turgidum subsp. durum]
MAARSGIVVVAAALLALVAVSQAQAPGPSATPAGPPNVTAILVKGGQYTTFMRLNSLTQQQQVSLVQAHILPQYYTMESFQTASNPVRTQASGEKEPITVNIVATNNQVNVTTGLVEVAVNNALSAVKPLAVYSVDKVLLPEALFGAKAPAPAPTASKGGKTKKGEAASGPAGSDDEATPTGAAGAKAVGWGVAGMAALLGYLL